MENDLTNLISVDKGRFIYVGKFKEEKDNSLYLTDVLTLSSKITLELTKEAQWSYKTWVVSRYKFTPEDCLERKADIRISDKITIHYL